MHARKLLQLRCPRRRCDAQAAKAHALCVQVAEHAVVVGRFTGAPPCREAVQRVLEGKHTARLVPGTRHDQALRGHFKIEGPHIAPKALTAHKQVVQVRYTDLQCDRGRVADERRLMAPHPACEVGEPSLHAGGGRTE